MSSFAADSGTIFAIGDLQGCFSSLMALLDALPSDFGQLWFAGDLVNRGPQSLETLAWLFRHGSGVRTVLGNHDLYALSRWSGIAPRKKSDTLDRLLADRRAGDYFCWLREQPFLYQDPLLPWAMVHAGLDFRWSLAEAASHAEELQHSLQGKNWKRFLRELWELPPPTRFEDCRNDADLFRLRIAIFTRTRWVREDGTYAWSNERPGADYRPWHRLFLAQQEGSVIFGHWATQGLLLEPRLLGLDSGCVWGRKLSAVRIDGSEPTLTQVDCPKLLAS